MKSDSQNLHFLQVRGIPGAGKTTVAKLIKGLNPEEVFIVATDNFWGPDEEFDPDRADEAHEWCKQQAEKATREKWPVVIVHNTAAEYYEMRSYEQIATEANYIYHRLIVEDHHGSGSTKDGVDEKLRDYMARKFQVSVKTPHKL